MTRDVKSSVVLPGFIIFVIIYQGMELHVKNDSERRPPAAADGSNCLRLRVGVAGTTRPYYDGTVTEAQH